MSVFPTGACSSFALFSSDFCWFIIVGLRIHETPQTGAVANRTYQVRSELEFTLSIAFYDGDLLFGQAVELINHLINQRVGLLNAGE